MKSTLINLLHSEERENDVQTVCNRVVTMNIQSTGDSGSGGQCPFCYKDCLWCANDVSEIEHEKHCIVLIAKDIITGFSHP